VIAKGSPVYVLEIGLKWEINYANWYYTIRFSNIAIWNTAMPTYDYSLQKWYEFISS
jgi:hypothetical protein